MKVNLRTPERHAELVRKQRKDIRDIADQLEDGKPLDGMQCDVAAAILRNHADCMSTEQPKPRGQPPKFPSGAAALHVQARIQIHGESQRQAIANVAEHFGVSDEAIKKALKKDGAEARSFLGMLQKT